MATNLDRTDGPEGDNPRAKHLRRPRRRDPLNDPGASEEEVRLAVRRRLLEIAGTGEAA